MLAIVRAKESSYQGKTRESKDKNVATKASFVWAVHWENTKRNESMHYFNLMHWKRRIKQSRCTARWRSTRFKGLVWQLETTQTAQHQWQARFVLQRRPRLGQVISHWAVFWTWWQDGRGHTDDSRNCLPRAVLINNLSSHSGNVLMQLTSTVKLLLRTDLEYHWP